MAAADDDAPTVTRSVALEFEVVADLADLDTSSQAWDALCRFVLGREEQGGHWAVTLALVDDDVLRELHARFMGLDSVTDVMTFPLDDAAVHGGDIVISVDRAAAQGPDHGLFRDEEIRFLFVHGLLHLCGWDDGSEARHVAMLARQTALLKAFERYL